MTSMPLATGTWKITIGSGSCPFGRDAVSESEQGITSFVVRLVWILGSRLTEKFQ
jgi:hypothetical protein